MCLSFGDSAAIASMLTFARRLGLYTFGKKGEKGRRMVGENYETYRSHYYNLILYKSASFIFRQLCSLNTLQNFDVNLTEHFGSSLL